MKVRFYCHDGMGGGLSSEVEEFSDDDLAGMDEGDIEEYLDDLACMFLLDHTSHGYKILE